MFVLFSDGTLGHDILCVVARQEGSDNDNHVELGHCDTEKAWTYDPRLALLQHQSTGQCLKVTIIDKLVSLVEVPKSPKIFNIGRMLLGLFIFKNLIEKTSAHYFYFDPRFTEVKV